MADTIRQAAKEILGVSIGKPKVHKESCWWNEEVKEKIMEKKTTSLKSFWHVTKR